MKRFGYVFVLLAFGFGEAGAQQFPPARVIAQGANGYEVVIGTDTFTAYSDSVVERITDLREDKIELERVNAKLQAMVAAYARTDTAQQRLRVVTKEYVSDLEAAVAGWRKLAEDYQKLNTPNTLSLQGALGFSGGDTKPAMLVGVGLGKLRVYGLLQESNVGGFAGIHLPIF